MTKSVLVMKHNNPKEALSEWAVALASESVFADSDLGKKIFANIKTLADDYSQLEFKTQRMVRKLETYGILCQEAAEEFLEDGDVGDLLMKLGDIKKTKTSLDDAADKHNEIQ
jgi:hypothetical protein